MEKLGADPAGAERHYQQYLLMIIAPIFYLFFLGIFRSRRTCGVADDAQQKLDVGD